MALIDDETSTAQDLLDVVEGADSTINEIDDGPALTWFKSQRGSDKLSLDGFSYECTKNMNAPLQLN